MSCRIEKDIFRLQIAINDVQCVDITDRQNDFGGIKSCQILGKRFKFVKVIVELTAGAIVQDEVQLVLRLECHVQADNEWVIDFNENISLGLCMFYLIELDRIILP